MADLGRAGYLYLTYMYFKLLCWMYLDDESPIDLVGVILYVSLFQA